jgi:hypothetical protein
MVKVKISSKLREARKRVREYRIREAQDRAREAQNRKEILAAGPEGLLKHLRQLSRKERRLGFPLDEAGSGSDGAPSAICDLAWRDAKTLCENGRIHRDNIAAAIFDLPGFVVVSSIDDGDEIGSYLYDLLFALGLNPGWADFEMWPAKVTTDIIRELLEMYARANNMTEEQRKKMEAYRERQRAKDRRKRRA